MSDNKDKQLDVGNERSAYLTSSRWVHEETPEFYEDEGRKRRERLARLQPRDATADNSGSAAPLAKFLNEQSRDTDAAASDRKRDDAEPGPYHKPIMVAAAEAQSSAHPEADQDHAYQPHVEGGDGKEIVCGPLLNYRRMEGNRWFGSVLCVGTGGGKNMIEQEDQVVLNIKRTPLRAGSTDGAEATNGTGEAGWKTSVNEVQACAHILYSDPRNTFWQFDVEVEMDPELETRWEYVIDGLRFPADSTKPQRNSFFAPSLQESMRILFFSCNGFSVGTDEDAWSGPALWNDVMRQQNSEAPFHVMLGGGDQIYNDGIRVSGPLREWTDISNPKKRRDHPYPEKLRQDCDNWYLRNYIRWYNTDPFSTANGQIAQINIWDDHDIIDGFGSYVNDFMMCDVFRGIGGTAHKYYMIFQHHLAPPPSTYVTGEAVAVSDAPVEGGQGIDPNQLIDTYVAEKRTDSSYVVGSRPGPYVAEHSHNIYAKLGARIAFAGIDARTERTRHQVNYPETYDLLFDRLDKELRAAKDSGTPFKHLVLLLGIPIAYPRLTWLENIFTSPLMGPIKFLNKRFGLGGSLFNKFDGSIDLLDDLDDHYTARTHKKERNVLVERLQSLAGRHSVRITILGGDVHLAAVGRFYSKPNLKRAVEKDERYMINIISSAIVNKPPPQAIANLLAKRNKIHHLNHQTDETLMDLFDKDPGSTNKTAASNHCTMPSRNYAMITENSPNNAPRPAQELENGESGTTPANFVGNNGHKPLSEGELVAGTKHIAATPQHGRGNDGSLDVCVRVEIEQHDPQGLTEGYGVTVLALDFSPEFGVPERGLRGAVSQPHMNQTQQQVEMNGASSS
ncbi:hypothetical protein MKZ38_005677 [Zalerion maritima]|uniref:PhoD-like phosphatase domain-containing protein n=1 Tax=Zalerion maritima TaxID=339359 RepID=A0AAD5RXV9_9PEZI|nr:hypothetical protein MKZ38_005677 [Zalerion maritima]